MKIREAIDRANNEKPSQIEEERMARWLYQLDYDIKENIIDAYNYNDDEEEIELGDYDDEQTDLIVPAPYDDLYVEFLKMQIDKANDETARYNNSAIFYNEAYTRFEKFYNKHHMHKGSKARNGQTHF